MLAAPATLPSPRSASRAARPWAVATRAAPSVEVTAAWVASTVQPGQLASVTFMVLAGVPATVVGATAAGGAVDAGGTTGADAVEGLVGAAAAGGPETCPDLLLPAAADEVAVADP